MLRLLLATCLTCLLVSSLGHAQTGKPEQEESAMPALAAGMAASLIPITVGGIVWSSGDSRLYRNGGLGIVHSGLVLGPLVGHLVGKEPRRAFFWSGISAGLGVLQTVLFIGYPDVLREGSVAGTPLTSQGAFYTILSAATLWSALAFADIAMGPARRARRARLRPSIGALPPALPRTPGAVTFDLVYP